MTSKPKSRIPASRNRKPPPTPSPSQVHAAAANPKIRPEKSNPKHPSREEEKYRNIVARMEEGFFETDLAGTFTFVNAAACRYSGYEPHELIGKNFRIGLSPESAKRIFAISYRVYQTGVPLKSAEFVIIRKDGSRRTHEMSLSLLRASSGEPIGFYGITRDLTDRVQLEKALRESEASYHKVILSTPIAMGILRQSDLRYVEVNDAFAPITGFSRKEAIGRTTSELNIYANPDDRQKVLEMLQRQGQVQGMETQLRARDGHVLDCLIYVTPMLYRGEQCLLTSTVDLTVIRKFEKALRESEESHRRLLEAAPYSIILTRQSDSRFVQVNENFCRRTGYRLDDTIGRTPLELGLYANPEDRSRFLETFRQAGRVYGMEIDIQTQSGQIFTNLVSALPIRFKGEDCILAMSVDITERKQAERELQEYRQRLEEMVQARTQALAAAQSELVKQEKLAVLGQLTATVSHELRNPLGVIRSSNFFLQKKIEAKEEKVNKHFKRIEEQISMCDAILSDLLEYTLGRSVSLVNEDPTPWLARVIMQFQESKGFTITRDFDPRPTKVPHDPEKIRRVITDGLNNALQAVQAREQSEKAAGTAFTPWIGVKTRIEGGNFVIQIADNGVGMSEETLQRAFEPLFTTRARGTGIGLANIKKIIGEHGGSVTLTSAMNQGTQMTISVPCAGIPEILPGK